MNNQERWFKKNDKGEIIFFPWGIFGKGYIVTEGKAQELKDFFNKQYKIGTLWMVFCLLLIVLLGGFVLFLIPIYCIEYKFKMNRLLKGCQKTSIRWTKKGLQ